jgi:hypothetical protein
LNCLDGVPAAVFFGGAKLRRERQLSKARAPFVFVKGRRDSEAYPRWPRDGRFEAPGLHVHLVTSFPFRLNLTTGPNNITYGVLRTYAEQSLIFFCPLNSKRLPRRRIRVRMRLRAQHDGPGVSSTVSALLDDYWGWERARCPDKSASLHAGPGLSLAQGGPDKPERRRTSK